MLTDFQIKELATVLLKNNSFLCPEVFNSDDTMKSEIRDKILEIINFHIEKISFFMTNFEVEDINLCGGITSHIYNDYTDIDACIVLKPKSLNQNPESLKKILRKLNSTVANMTQNIRLCGRKIDIGFVTHFNNGSGTYSLLKNEWLTKPFYRKYAFSMKDFVLGYMEYEQKIDNYIIALEKLPSNFLSAKSCEKLEEHLFNLKKNSMIEKTSSEEKEYGLNINFYRFFAKSGKLNQIYSYIADSYDHIINHLDENDERNT